MSGASLRGASLFVYRAFLLLIITSNAEFSNINVTKL